jgi:threonine aldolase
LYSRFLRKWRILQAAMNFIELRSDTFTRPTPGMLQAMMNAHVGDDVFGEDPTVNELQTYTANLFGMEEALFCPSGTMTNQIAIMVHTRPGDEVICEALSHIYVYEGGGMARNSGVQPRLLPGDRGRISAAQVEEAINPDDVHRARTALVSLEHTANRGGGSCYNMNTLESIRALCYRHQLPLHLDGARIFNALQATGQNAAQLGSIFNSISVCLSKGLGAPVGSLLLGTSGFIKEARRCRKVMGGGMRQAGFLAAAGLYALKHQVLRLEEDHRHASILEKALHECRYVESVMPVETNIVIFNIKTPHTAADIAQKLLQQGIRVAQTGAQQIRLVTHLDVSGEMVEQACQALRRL